MPNLENVLQNIRQQQHSQQQEQSEENDMLPHNLQKGNQTVYYLMTTNLNQKL